MGQAVLLDPRRVHGDPVPGVGATWGALWHGAHCLAGQHSLPGAADRLHCGQGKSSRTLGHTRVCVRTVCGARGELLWTGVGPRAGSAGAPRRATLVGAQVGQARGRGRGGKRSHLLLGLLMRPVARGLHAVVPISLAISLVCVYVLDLPRVCNTHWVMSSSKCAKSFDPLLSTCGEPQLRCGAA